MNRDIANMRKHYLNSSMDMGNMLADPIKQFQEWFEAAIASGEKEPNAMTLATCSAEGHPSARIVLLKEVDKRGFVFYTNYNSRKGQEIEAIPYAALVFCWLSLERQVRIEGKVMKVSTKESDAYYHKRPKESQIGAWASPQSRVIDDREVLESNLARLQKEHGDKDFIPRPSNWGGYRVEPAMIEYWQGRTSRLHDRIRYTKNKGTWIRERLAP